MLAAICSRSLPNSKLIGAAPAAAGDHRRSGPGLATPDRRSSDVVSPLALLARLVSVALPLAAMPGYRRGSRAPSPLLTRAARAAISPALVLSLSPTRAKRHPGDHLRVVVFSILVQGSPWAGSPGYWTCARSGRDRTRRPRAYPRPAAKE
jgi:hypothetical protein